MGNYSYLPQFPIQTATTVLPLNTFYKKKKHFAKVLIDSSPFLKLLSLCNLFIFSNYLLYDFMPTFQTLFWYQMWYNLRHGGHDCFWYHIYVHDNYVCIFIWYILYNIILLKYKQTIVKILCALELFLQDARPLILKIKQIAFFFFVGRQKTFLL